ncbi:IclR family transcriptional regulator [Rhodococcus sp. ACT016]|uniref:IclR family transcriptional regulator n=1 Tax=Rhodococcus sp. ACT016 TaxID=3134808 RepID=UPI003D2A03D7
MADSAAIRPRPARESLLARMTAIVDAFTDPNSDLNLDQISHRAELPRSTTHRIVVDLIDLGWLERSGRDYRLGWRALGAVGPQAVHARIRVGAHDILQELFLRTGMVIHLGVLDGGHEYFLDKIGGLFSRRLASRVGARLAAHRGAGGRSMLALLRPEEVDDLVAPALAVPQPNATWTVPSLHAELARIRERRGIAFESVTTPSGSIGSVGCAIRSRDGVAISLCLAGDAGVVRPDKVVPLVREAAHALERAV